MELLGAAVLFDCCPLLPVFCSDFFVPNSSLILANWKQHIQIGEEEVMLSLSAQDMIVHTENLRGTWVAQLVKHPTLDISSGLNSHGHEFKHLIVYHSGHEVYFK